MREAHKFFLLTMWLLILEHVRKTMYLTLFFYNPWKDIWANTVNVCVCVCVCVCTDALFVEVNRCQSTQTGVYFRRVEVGHLVAREPSLVLLMLHRSPVCVSFSPYPPWEPYLDRKALDYLKLFQFQTFFLTPILFWSRSFQLSVAGANATTGNEGPLHHFAASSDGSLCVLTVRYWSVHNETWSHCGTMSVFFWSCVFLYLCPLLTIGYIFYFQIVWQWSLICREGVLFSAVLHRPT